MQLCKKTITALEKIEEIPTPLLVNANSDMIANNGDRPPVIFVDETFGDARMDFSTCLYVAEQLFRFQTCTTTLAYLLNGKFGEMLTRMMVNSAMKQKHKHKSEAKFVHRRTSFSNKRSLMDEVEIIQETAQCVLFGAVEKMRLLVPIKIGDFVEQGSTRWVYNKDSEGNRVHTDNVHTTWRDFYAYCPITGDEVRCAAMFDGYELSLLNKIVEHNQNCGPNSWQFFVANARQSDLVCKYFDNDDSVIVIRRVLSSLRRPTANCIMAAFGAATVRFFILEYGHNTELTEAIVEHSDDKFARYNPEMVCLEVREQFEKDLDPIDRLIVDVSESSNSPKEVFSTLVSTMEKPISQATFYRRWDRLKMLAERLVLDLT